MKVKSLMSVNLVTVELDDSLSVIREIWRDIMKAIGNRINQSTA